MTGDFSILSKPVTLPVSGKEIKWPFLKSAMTERLCTWSKTDFQERGKPTEEYREIYKRWGQGHIGVVVLGNIPTDVRYPEAEKNACIDRESTWDQVEAFKPVIANAKAGGALCIGQLTHAGRQTAAHIQEQPLSSSDVQCPPVMGMSFNKPRPMTIEEIEDLQDRFAYAANVLYKAGADGAQLHCAHGYLLSQFLSPKVNKRTDKYGGSFENRSRIVFEIISAIRKRVPDTKFIISIKYNSQDFIEGGFSAEESKEMAIKMEQAGVELIELSGGTYESGAFAHKKESTIKREAYFIEFAQNIRPHLKKAVLAVTGGFRSAEAMAKAINEGSCDLIGLGRPLTAEPDLPLQIQESGSQGARPNLVDASLQTPAAIRQIAEFGSKKEISDLSKEDVAKEVEDTLKGSRKPEDKQNYGSNKEAEA